MRVWLCRADIFDPFQSIESIRKDEVWSLVCVEMSTDSTCDALPIPLLRKYSCGEQSYQ